ncbi:aromatic-ring hydroxylase C-terminal domain-containing protein [Streptomyces sp. NPDC001606]
MSQGSSPVAGPKGQGRMAPPASGDFELSRLSERPFVLVRPDGHVAWRGDGLPRDPAESVDTVRRGRV